MQGINEKDYRRLKPDEVFQEGDRIGLYPYIERSLRVRTSIGEKVKSAYGWRPIEKDGNEDALTLNPGDIIEWSGNEGFIIPNAFNTNGAVHIAWTTGSNEGRWTWHADVNIQQAIREGKFKVKEGLNE